MNSSGNNYDSREDAQAAAALYALGALTQHDARAFEARLAENEHGEAEDLAAFNDVAATIGLTAREVAPPDDLRGKLLSRISNEEKTDPHRQFFNLRSDEGEWQELGAGISIKKLFADGETGAVTSLVKMLPGTRLPKHRHAGTEQFYILEGDCNVHGVALGPGDFHAAAPGSIHEFTFTIEGAKFLLIARS